MIGRIRLTGIAVLALLAFTLPTAAQVVANGSRRSTEVQAFFDKGQTYINAGQYKEAVEAYKQGIRLNPNNADAYASLGYAYSLLKNATEDLDAAKKALQIEPTHPYANARLCYAYSKLNQYEQAVHACKKAIQYNPRKSNPFNSIRITLRHTATLGSGSSGTLSRHATAAS